MAIADGGELLILAPGVETFGEDAQVDVLIRKYGYCGRERVLELLKSGACNDLVENLSAAAHLIHGSTDGRFTVTYAVQPSMRAQIECVQFQSADADEMLHRITSYNVCYTKLLRAVLFAQLSGDFLSGIEPAKRQMVQEVLVKMMANIERMTAELEPPKQ